MLDQSYRLAPEVLRGDRLDRPCFGVGWKISLQHV